MPQHILILLPTHNGAWVAGRPGLSVPSFTGHTRTHFGDVASLPEVIDGDETPGRMFTLASIQYTKAGNNPIAIYREQVTARREPSDWLIAKRGKEAARLAMLAG
jgi:hypothetical protein